MEYHDFVRAKLGTAAANGIAEPVRDYGLFPHQRDLTAWALRRGRAAIFADTGLGKSRMQLAWADTVHRETGSDVLILAPLAVAEQTAEEGESIGVAVTHAREGADVRPGITITNYDRLHKFNVSRFGGVVLDESSIIKHHAAKTLQTLLDSFDATPYKLCATATPAPNDWTELGNHAQFLGVRSRAEMLAEFFVHDGGDTQTWRLKGHARQVFWRWVASWGAMVRSPADLGHDASAYALPPLNVYQHTVETEHNPAHGLFAMEAQTLMERRDARRASLVERVRATVLKIKDENDRMAASYYAECCHGLETGIRGEQETAGSGESGTAGETPSLRESESGAESGSPQGIHAGVLQEQPGQVAEAFAGEAGPVQRDAAGEVRGGSGVSGGTKGEVSGVAEIKSAQEEESAASGNIWDRTERLPGHAGDAEGRMRDLRVFGHEQSEVLPGRGSLSHDGEGSRPAVHELQQRSRKVQGRHEHLVVRNRVPTEKWLIWCELNDEQDALEVALRVEGISYVSVRGNTDLDKRVDYERAWRLGNVQVMISKPSVFGWGLNWQHCARMAFVGVTDSFEAYYQAVRRCWRFGQQRPVDVHVFASQQEGAVVANLRRKEADARAMADAMAAETLDAVRENILGRTKDTNPYHATARMLVPSFMEAA